MINFTVGPVQSDDEVRAIGAEQVPYFRTPEFSELMKENEKLMLKFAKASEGSRAVFITGSGTASMESVVMNVLNENDKALVVNGGTFGERFVKLCDIHNVDFSEIKLDMGKALKSEDLEAYNNKGYTAFLVNLGETSTGVLYDIELISDFCQKNNMLLIVDAISAFLSDSIDMDKNKIDVLITGSQKALACPPGISIIVLSDKAIDIVQNNKTKCMYLDIKDALKNGERGQTPFTPAVGILRQLNKRLREIDEIGGVEAEQRNIKLIAQDFRERIKELPLEIVSESLSNTVTPLHPLNVSAYDIFTILKDEYDIWVCPNGGDLKDEVFRVGHIGALTLDDNKKLCDSLYDMMNRGLL